MWAHSGEWARGSQLGLRDLQLLERCIADDVEASPTVYQHVIEPDVGYDRAVTRGSTPAPAMFSEQSDGPKEMVVFLHLWCGAAFGTLGFAERVFTSRLETSSQLPPYITYGFLRRSSLSESELSWL